uniref:CCHC-type domain-containing protein n=1 Tax=Solanum lycopersicum TaxID=4081 RepID=A0A3Q7HGR1_SOLLC
MPATAGRVRMPANNRVHSSAALQTHGIWQSAIGYDPYAPSKDEDKKSSNQKPSSAADPENAYASFQGLLALARITGSNADETRGACKRCGRVGHLTFQCRNFVSVKDDNKDKDAEAIEAAVLSGLEKIKGHGSKMKGKAENEDSSEEEEESESSDSDYDSEMERAIAEKYGKKVSRKLKSSSKKHKKKDSDSDDEHADSSAESSDESPPRHKRRSRRAAASASDSDASNSDDARVGRDKKRSEKRSRKRHDDEDTASVIQDIAILVELASCYPFEGFVGLLVTIRNLCNFIGW